MKDPALVERIAGADPERAAILRSFPSEVVSVPTPFYRAVRVVDLDVSTEVGPMRLRYGLEGEAVVPLGDRPEGVYELNGREGLRLGREGVRAYLRFFFDSVGGRRMRIVERAEEVPWRKGAPAEAPPSAVRPGVKPISVEPGAAGGYRAVANALWNAMLVEVTLDVSPEGRVEPASQRMVAEFVDVVPG